MTVRVFEQHMKEGHPEKMYKTVGNAYILVNASSLMKRLSVWFTSYSPHFYGHKKSCE